MKKLKYYQEQDSIFYKLNLIKDVEKCQDVYADLHFFEIYLMHNIHQEYSKHYGEDWKNDNQFWKNGNSFEYQQFIDNGKITLGFWVYLFRNNPHKYFKESSNNKGNISLKNIFPGLSPKKLTHKIIHSDLQKIKNFRNVIFHFDIESFILDKNNKPTKTRYIDEFKYYQELTQEYTEALACDKVFLHRKEENIYTHLIQDYISKIDGVTRIFEYIGNNLDKKDIWCVFKMEYKKNIIRIIYPYASIGDIFDVSKLVTNNDINIIIYNEKMHDWAVFLLSYDKYRRDNGTCITTLEELPNLLNTIQNDNAN